MLGKIFSPPCSPAWLFPQISSFLNCNYHLCLTLHVHLMCFGSAESQFMSVYSSLSIHYSLQEGVCISLFYFMAVLDVQSEPWHLPSSEHKAASPQWK